MSTAYKSHLTDDFLNSLAEGKGRVILCASAPNQVAQESDKLKHGVFTYHILKGLKGKVDTEPDGLIDVEELFKYVSMKVLEETKRSQQPVLKANIEGKFVVGRYTKTE